MRQEAAQSMVAYRKVTMRKLLLLLILVIILVSLNWFNKLVAQDLSQLNADEKEALMQKYRAAMQARTSAGSTDTYETPPLYDSGTVVRLPDNGIQPAPAERADEQAGVLPSFESLQPFGL